MTETIEQYQATIERIKALREEATAQARTAFEAASKDLFEKHGEVLGGFGWAQYTPYFNDGDPCVFGARNDYPFLFAPGPRSEEEQDDLREDINDYETSRIYSSYADESKVNSDDKENFDQRYADAKTDVEAFCKVWDEDTLLELFGDHVEITVTASGVEVEEYYHD